jgi:integrase
VSKKAEAEQGLTVNQARDAAEKVKADIKANGVDPLAEKQRLAEQRKESERQRQLEKLKLVTLDELFNSWDGVVLSRHKDKGAGVREIMKAKVLNKYGSLPAREFGKAEIMRITDIMLSDGKQRMAKKTFSLIRQMMRFAEIRGIVDIDPTHKIEKKKIGGADVERDRVLCATDEKPDEIKPLFKQLPDSGLTATTQYGLYICLATCCRIGELLSAQWKHFDFDSRYWLIPGENSKNGKPHAIYLSDFALSYIKRLKEITGWSEWLYPSGDGTSPVGTRNITKQVGDRQSQDEPLKGRTKNNQTLILPHGRWTPHDLRRTGASLMVELGVMPEVVERCLNHTEENRVKRTYQRFSYKPQMKAAWELLGERLSVLRDGGENVVILGARKAG